MCPFCHRPTDQFDIDGNPLLCNLCYEAKLECEVGLLEAKNKSAEAHKLLHGNLVKEIFQLFLGVIL